MRRRRRPWMATARILLEWPTCDTIWRFCTDIPDRSMSSAGAAGNSCTQSSSSRQCAAIVSAASPPRAGSSAASHRSVNGVSALQMNRLCHSVAASCPDAARLDVLGMNLASSHSPAADPLPLTSSRERQPFWQTPNPMQTTWSARLIKLPSPVQVDTAQLLRHERPLLQARERGCTVRRGRQRRHAAAAAAQASAWRLRRRSGGAVARGVDQLPPLSLKIQVLMLGHAIEHSVLTVATSSTIFLRRAAPRLMQQGTNPIILSAPGRAAFADCRGCRPAHHAASRAQRAHHCPPARPLPPAARRSHRCGLPVGVYLPCSRQRERSSPLAGFNGCLV